MAACGLAADAKMPAARAQRHSASATCTTGTVGRQANGLRRAGARGHGAQGLASDHLSGIPAFSQVVLDVAREHGIAVRR